MKLVACIALVVVFALGVNAGSSPLASEPVAVTPCVEYNAWPMIQAVGEKLVCAYSRGSAHSIGEGCRGVFAKVSCDGGGTWSEETRVVNDPDVGEVTIGKGLDDKGAMLLWVRNWARQGGMTSTARRTAFRSSGLRRRRLIRCRSRSPTCFLFPAPG